MAFPRTDIFLCFKQIELFLHKPVFLQLIGMMGCVWSHQLPPGSQLPILYRAEVKEASQGRRKVKHPESLSLALTVRGNVCVGGSLTGAWTPAEEKGSPQEGSLSQWHFPPTQGSGKGSQLQG